MTVLTTDFENLGDVKQQGWTQFLPGDSESGVEVTLSPESPQKGKYCLRLRANNGSTLGGPETPAVWVNSPALNISPNDTIRVRLWVRARQSSTKTNEFIAFDSAGGPGRAERVHHDSDWKAVTWFRRVDRPQKFVITLALMGPGEAFVDSLSVDVFPTTGSAPPGLMQMSDHQPNRRHAISSSERGDVGSLR